MPARDLIVDLVVGYGFQVLGAIVILAAGIVLARWTGRIVERRLLRQDMEPPMRQLLIRTLRVVVMLFALVVALDKFGFQIAPLVAGIGVAGLGLGIALQGVLGNLMAGLNIIFTKPFRVGEHISVAGVHGDVGAVGVVGPHRPAQLERHEPHLLPVARDQVELRLHHRPDVVERRRRAFEQPDGADVHVAPPVLHVEERGVLRAHPVHSPTP